MNNGFDTLRLSVEAKSGGKNTVILDDVGMPSIMVRVPKFKISEVMPGGPAEWHPMFIVNGELRDVLYIGKYGACIENDRAYSLPYRDPAAWVDFDRARQVCRNKGPGWHCMTNAEFAGLALWCKANGYMPTGNNYCGCDIDHRHEKGVQSYDWVLNYNWGDGMANKIEGSAYHHTGRVYTGSGPVSWAHDGTTDGIYDLNGNMWEWTPGMRLVDGEIQIIPDNNSAGNVDESPTSTLWRAIMPDGALVAPGTAGTLKYDATNANGSGAFILNTTVEHPGTDAVSTHTSFSALTAKAGVEVPDILKYLGLFPYDTTENGHGKDGFWGRNNGERLPFRGGSWAHASASGVFACYLDVPRARSWDDVGFRAAFCEM